MRMLSRPIAVVVGSLAALSWGLRDPSRGDAGSGLGRLLFAQVRDAAVPATGTAIISGTVVTDDEAHRPLRRAVVAINGGDLRSGKLMSTDEAGHFQISGLTAGTYYATVSKPGFVTTYYGSRHPGRSPGTPFVVANGQQLQLTIPVAHGAVLSGLITDTFGRPLPGVRVTALEWRTVNGERRLSNVSTNGSNGVAGTTDERGMFRLWGLPPGTFLVQATPNGVATNQEIKQIASGDLDWAKQQLTSKAPVTAAPNVSRPVGYTTVFYPGVTDWTLAAELVLAAGQEHSGVDFPVPLVPTATVAGTVVGLDGQPVSGGMQVMLTAARGPQAPNGAFLPVPLASRGMSVGRTGRFSMAGIAPGQYTLTVRGSSRGGGPAEGPVPPAPPQPSAGGGAGPLPPPPPPQPLVQDLFATLDLSVAGEDLTDLVLALRPGMTVSGQVTFTGTSPVPTDLTRVRVGLGAVTTDRLAFNVPQRPGAATGTFTLTGVTPGRYWPTAAIARLSNSGRGGPAAASDTNENPWHLAAALWQGRDLLDFPLDIHPNEDISGVSLVFSDLTTELSGSLLGSTGQPVSGYFVVVFPTDSALWAANSRRTRQSQPQPDGTFKFTGLPPGTYYLGAVTDLDAGDLSDPTFLGQLAPASLKITLTEGGKVAQSIRLREPGTYRPTR